MNLHNLLKYDLIVMWGCGNDITQYKKQFYVDYIVDKDIQKIGKQYCGIEIKSVSALIEDSKSKKTLVIISTTKYKDEIIEEINELGVLADVVEMSIMKAFYGCENQSFALWGFDVLVRDLFIRGGYDVSELSYIEVGAAHPIFGNTTEIFSIAGAKGILVEPNPDLQHELMHYREQDMCLMCGVAGEKGSLKYYRFNNAYRNTFDKSEALDALHKGFEKKDELDIPVLTLDEIIHEHRINTQKTFLSIQAMGLEKEILKNFEYKKYYFPVIAIAYYSEDIFQYPMFQYYCEIARVPRHVVLVNREIYKKILG
jgi:FkbM family methyltransferase